MGVNIAPLPTIQYEANYRLKKKSSSGSQVPDNSTNILEKLVRGHGSKK